MSTTRATVNKNGTRGAKQVVGIECKFCNQVSATQGSQLRFYQCINDTSFRRFGVYTRFSYVLALPVPLSLSAQTLP